MSGVTKKLSPLWAISLMAASIPWSWWRVDCFIEAEDEASISTWNHDLYYELSSFVFNHPTVEMSDQISDETS